MSEKTPQQERIGPSGRQRPNESGELYIPVPLALRRMGASAAKARLAQVQRTLASAEHRARTRTRNYGDANPNDFTLLSKCKCGRKPWCVLEDFPRETPHRDEFGPTRRAWVCRCECGNAIGRQRLRGRIIAGWNRSAHAEPLTRQTYPFFRLADKAPEVALDYLEGIEQDLTLRREEAYLKLVLAVTDAPGPAFVQRLEAYLAWCQTAKVLVKRELGAVAREVGR